MEIAGNLTEDHDARRPREPRRRAREKVLVEQRMSYVVLARKWRPQSFEDLVGQEHVSTTLGNAIARDRVAHAFLFTGVRGVGKTTSARILAKALNCVEGPTARPCQTCAPCTEITAGADVDVQEIDGASYNGVDEVRRLQESLPYRPSRDRFKIFIVDEVHMLSNAAWNAFLKTLEEPPPHVKFIFATTEVHKVPVTILSRCQRYDFKLLSAQAIAARLRWVLEQEKIPADDAAVSTVAREAAGSMRDAMSLLDQVIAWVGTSGDRVTGEGVARVLGVADRLVLHRLADALVGGDPATCLQIVGELAQEGYDLPHVARDILAHLRDVVVAKVCEEPGTLLDLADAEIADVKALAARADADDLARLHQGFSRAFDDIVRSGQPRASLEMALVRLARRPPLLPIDELLRRLGDLERRIAGGGPPPGAAPDRSPPRPAAPQGPPRRSASPAAEALPAEAAPAATPAPTNGVASAAPEPVMRRVAERPANEEARPTPPKTEAPARAAPVESRPAPVESRTNGAGTEAPRPMNGAGAGHRNDDGAGNARRSAPPPASSAQAPGSARAPSTTVDLGAWRGVIDGVRRQRPALASVLEHAIVLELGPERAVVGYAAASSFLFAQATEPAARQVLTSALRAHFGQPVELAIETLTSSSNGAVSIAQLESAERKARADAARRAVIEHPLVAAAIDLLGAEIKDIRLAQDALEN